MSGLVAFSSPQTRGESSHAAGSPNHPWEPGRLKKLADFKLGWMHGAQYMINPKSTPETIERDFKAMAEEDNINYVRLAFWGCSVGKKIDYTLFDACFEAAARHSIKLNPALPQIPGWRTASRMIRPCDRLSRSISNRSSAATRTSRLWASGRWKWSLRGIGKRSLPPVTVKLFREWLKETLFFRGGVAQSGSRLYILRRRVSRKRSKPGRVEQLSRIRRLDDLLLLRPGRAGALHLRGGPGGGSRSPGQLHPTRRPAQPGDCGRAQDVVAGRRRRHPQPPDGTPLALGDGRHAARPVCRRGVLAAQSLLLGASTGISCDGEFLAGPDLGESPRLFSTTAGDLLGTDLMHLAEGSKGFLYWVWNALAEGPNAGAWSLRNLDGSPSEARPHGGPIRPDGAAAQRSAI